MGPLFGWYEVEYVKPNHELFWTRVSCNNGSGTPYRVEWLTPTISWELSMTTPWTLMKYGNEEGDANSGPKLTVTVRFRGLCEVSENPFTEYVMVSGGTYQKLWIFGANTTNVMVSDLFLFRAKEIGVTACLVGCTFGYKAIATPKGSKDQRQITAPTMTAVRREDANQAYFDSLTLKDSRRTALTPRLAGGR
jgi:hypothetical protein